MRSVFVLYAEDRNLLSNDSVFTNHYSVVGLFNRLRSDAGRYPDTMDQRYGAWAQLLTLFRMIYEGGSHGEFRIPGRKGYLFDPDRYNFWEGRQWKTARRHIQARSASECISSPAKPRRSQKTRKTRLTRLRFGLVFRMTPGLMCREFLSASFTACSAIY